MAALGKVSRLRRWLFEQVLGNQLWSEVRIRGFEAGKDQGPPPPLTPLHPPDSAETAHLLLDQERMLLMLHVRKVT